MHACVSIAGVNIATIRNATYRTEVALCDDPGPCIQAQLHLANLLVDLLHELDDEIDELVLEHRLGVCICDEKGDVVARHGFPAQDDKGLCKTAQR